MKLAAASGLLAYLCCAACGGRTGLDAFGLPAVDAGVRRDASTVVSSPEAGAALFHDAGEAAVDAGGEASLDAGVPRADAGCDAGPTCGDLGLECGTVVDGCGGTVACGGCPLGSVCGLGGQPGRCAPVTVDCHDDELSGVMPIGHLTTHTAGGMVALCSGHVLLGNRDDRSIDWVDVRDGKTVRSYPLSAPPWQLARDEKRHQIYVAHEWATFISVVDLDTSSVRTVDVGNAVRAVSSGAGYVFVLTLDGFTSNVVVLSADTLDVLARQPTVVNDAWMIAFDPRQSRLIVASGGSPPELASYSFHASTVSLTLERSMRSAGGNCHELGFSPDGLHFAMSCGAGNSTVYTIFDWKADDLNAKFGEFDTGAYPSGVAFTSDGARFGTTNTQELFTFDVVTHEILDRVNFEYCGINWPIWVTFSAGDRMLFAYSVCIRDNELWWRIVP